MEANDFIIYLLMCNELPQKLVSKTTNIYYLRVSLGHESLKGWAGLFWLKVFHEVAVQRINYRQIQSQVLGRLWFHTGYWLETSVLCHMGPSIGSLSFLTTWVIQERASQNNHDRIYRDFLSPSLEVIHCHFLHILLEVSNLGQAILRN